MPPRLAPTAVLVAGLLVAGCARPAAPPPDVASEIRHAIATNDLEAARIAVARGGPAAETPDALEQRALLARAEGAAAQADAARRDAQTVFDAARAAVRGRPVDEDAHLATAIGLAVEVLGQDSAERGDRSGAVAFLNDQLAAYRGTSIEKRIEKNLNLLTLEGATAPPLDLSESLDATPLPTLASLQGHPLVLFFWAHWCPDCKAEGPILERLVAKYKPNGLRLVAPTQRYGYVAGGDPAAPEVEKPYIDRVRHQYYAWLVGEPVPLAAANHTRYGVTSTPTLVLVDRTGRVALYHPGTMTEEALEAGIRTIVGAN